MICVCGTQISEGSRRVTVSLDVNWGDLDIRENHSKTATFCSFGCLADWAREKADAHDGHAIVEGARR